MTAPIGTPVRGRRSRWAAVLLIACWPALSACAGEPAAGMPAGPVATSGPVASASGTSTITPGSAGTPAPSVTRLTVSEPVAPGGPGQPAPTDAVAQPEHRGTIAASQRLTFVPQRVALRHDGRVSSAAVHPVGTGGGGELELPADVGDVGWWRGGALAGELYGSVVLAGHIDSRDQGIGVFAALLAIRSGDRVSLTDGQLVQDYVVSSRRQIPKDVLATGTDTFSPSVSGRLVLITCTGRFNAVTRHYADNLVVIAAPRGPARPV